MQQCCYAEQCTQTGTFFANHSPSRFYLHLSKITQVVCVIQRVNDLQSYRVAVDWVDFITFTLVEIVVVKTKIKQKIEQQFAQITSIPFRNA
jgi:hypothetical protein